MPQQIDLTVKKADGTTDITYVKVQPSSGTTSPAVWRSPVGAAPAHKAELRVKAFPNKAGTVRRVEGVYISPQTVTATDGSVTVANRLTLAFQGVVPQSMPQSEINEAVRQGFNLFASVHVKAQVEEGFAAN
jgi:hypothetical protein